MKIPPISDEASDETKNTSHRVEGLNLIALLFSHRYGMWDSVSGQALTSFEELLALYLSP
jgi:hypothetical protein